MLSWFVFLKGTAAAVAASLVHGIYQTMYIYYSPATLSHLLLGPKWSPPLHHRSKSVHNSLPAWPLYVALEIPRAFIWESFGSRLYTGWTVVEGGWMAVSVNDGIDAWHRGTCGVRSTVDGRSPERVIFLGPATAGLHGCSCALCMC